MRTVENKAGHVDQEQCSCARCRARRAGLGPGPYTNEEYKLIADTVEQVEPPSVDRYAGDPRVQKAVAALQVAQDAYDRAQGRWETASRKLRKAEAEVRNAPVAFTADLVPADPVTSVGRGEYERLRGAEEDAKAEREQAGRRRQAARVEHTQARKAAERRG